MKNTVMTDTYGEFNIIESEFWGKGDNGEKITTILNLTTENEECDIFIDDIFLVSTFLNDVGNELDYYGIQII